MNPDAKCSCCGKAGLIVVRGSAVCIVCDGLQLWPPYKKIA